MSDFGIDIKVKSTNAEAAISGVSERLGRAKAKAEEMSAGASSAFSRMTGALNSVKSSLESVGSKMSLIAGGFIAGKAVQGLSEMADAAVGLKNKLRPIIGTEEAVEAKSEELYQMSQKLRIGWEATAAVYSRVALAGKDLGITQGQVTDFTRQLSMAVKISGATAAEAQAAMIQLSQGMASGTLRGDELRSVLEQLPTVADVIAKGLGVTRGELRKMGEDGLITTQIIMDSFSKADDELKEKFGQTVPTISERIQQMKDSFMRMIGALADTGVFDLITSALNAVAYVLDKVADGFKLLKKGFEFVRDAADYILGPLYDVTEQTKELTYADDAAAFSARELAHETEKLADAYSKRLAVAKAVKETVDRERSSDASTERAKLKKDIENLNAAIKAQDEYLRDFKTIYGEGPGRVIELGNLTLEQAIKKREELVKRLNDLDPSKRKRSGRSEKEEKPDHGKPDAWREEFEKGWADFLEAQDAPGQALRSAAESTAAGIRASDVTYQYRDRIVELNNAMEQGTITRAQYTEQTDAARESLNGAIKAADDAKRAEQERIAMLNATDFQKLAEQIWSVKEAKAQALQDLMTGAEDQFVNLVTNFRIEWKSLIDQMIADIARIAFRKAMLSIFSGGGDSFIPGLPGHAEGADFRVGGHGGTDSQVVAFRASPNERVTVTPQHDQRPGGGDQMRAQAPSVRVVNVYDKSAMVDALNSNDGERAILNVLRRNPNLVRSLRAG